MKNENVLQVIRERYRDFSKSNKKIANFILSNFNKFPFLTLIELEKKIGVSVATISRFSSLLGYKNFSSFQKEFESLIESKNCSFEELKTNVSSKSKNILVTEIENAIEALENLYHEELDKTLRIASKKIYNAKKVVILGSRTSKSMALLFYYLLTEIREDVYFLENKNEDISFKLLNIDKDDLLVAISYPKYTKITFQLIKYFYEKKSEIITITDSITSSIASLSSVAIIARNSSKTYTFVSTMTIINTLVLMVAAFNAKLSIKRLNQQNKIANQLGIYLDDLNMNI